MCLHYLRSIFHTLVIPSFKLIIITPSLIYRFVNSPSRAKFSLLDWIDSFDAD